MITIKVNQKEYSFPKSISLQEVLDQLEIVQNGIAVAVNEGIVTKSDWCLTKLNNNDDILIIQATQGG